MMNLKSDFEATGPFEARYIAFLETIVHHRARLHRYCARMTGSSLYGEDVMQETLFEAYRHAGVDVQLDVFPGQQHSFQMAAGRAPEADDAIGKLAQWMRPRLGLADFAGAAAK
jgi:acetyl esterase/lipase